MNPTPPPSADTPLAGRSGDATSIRHRICLFGGMLILAAAVFMVFYPAAGGPFIFDDALTIVDNPSIRQLSPLFGSGNNPGPLNPSQGTPVSARPLVSLSLAINYHYGGLDPFGYRIVHIVIHLLSAMLLWSIVVTTLRLEHFQGRFDHLAQPLAFATALVWALHPVNTETVVYVTQRTELMMGLFYLATLFFSIRYLIAKRPAARATYLALTTLACCSGMLCKEVMASVPAMVLLYERTFIADSFRRILKRSWPLYVCLALGWLTMLAIYYHGSRTPGGGFGMGMAAHQWWFTQSKVIFLYLKLAVWPWPLVIHYEVPILKSIAEAWPWVSGTALLAACTLWLVWRRSAVGYVAIWFFAVLSPTLLIPLPGETAVERRMYIPLAALVPLLIVGGYVVLERSWRFIAQHQTPHQEPGSAIHRGPAVAFTTATIALVIGFGFLCSRRLVVFQDELVLWQDAKIHQPYNPAVWINLGTQLAKKDQLPEALTHFEEAVRLDPESHKAHYNLASALEVSTRPQDAVKHYRMALKFRPEDAATHYNLARLLEAAGSTQQASKHYRLAIAAHPDFSAAHTNLGLLLLSSGRTQEAIGELEDALRVQEDLANYMNLILAYSQDGRTADATSTVEKALKLARAEGNTPLANRLEKALTQLRAQTEP